MGRPKKNTAVTTANRENKVTTTDDKTNIPENNGIQPLDSVVDCVSDTFHTHLKNKLYNDATHRLKVMEHITQYYETNACDDALTIDFMGNFYRLDMVEEALFIYNQYHAKNK